MDRRIVAQLLSSLDGLSEFAEEDLRGAPPEDAAAKAAEPAAGPRAEDHQALTTSTDDAPMVSSAVHADDATVRNAAMAAMPLAGADRGGPAPAAPRQRAAAARKPKGAVVVIGATNRPDALDSALRRAGRFEREICLGVPDAAAREKILSVLTARMRLDGDFDYAQLAKARRAALLRCAAGGDSFVSHCPSDPCAHR